MSSRLVATAVVTSIVALAAFEPGAAAQTNSPASTTPATPAKTTPATTTPAATTPAATTPATTTPAAATPAATTPAATAPAATTPAATTPAGTATATTEPAAADGHTQEQRRAIYISVDFGFTRADIGALSDKTNFDRTGANGILAGLGIGYRHNRLRFGGRFRDASTTQFNLWSLMGEIGYGFPMFPITPVIFAHAGYMFDSGIERSTIASSLPAGNVLTPNLGLDGAVAGVEVLGNIHVSEFLRIGPFVGFDLTWLHRKQVDLPQSIVPLTDATKNNPLYTDSGSGVGYVFSLGVRGTGDIAF
jgi:hypothetical protein